MGTDGCRALGLYDILPPVIDLVAEEEKSQQRAIERAERTRIALERQDERDRNRAQRERIQAEKMRQKAERDKKREKARVEKEVKKKAREEKHQQILAMREEKRRQDELKKNESERKQEEKRKRNEEKKRKKAESERKQEEKRKRNEQKKRDNAELKRKELEELQQRNNKEERQKQEARDKEQKELPNRKRKTEQQSAHDSNKRQQIDTSLEDMVEEVDEELVDLTDLTRDDMELVDLTDLTRDDMELVDLNTENIVARLENAPKLDTGVAESHRHAKPITGDNKREALQPQQPIAQGLHVKSTDIVDELPEDAQQDPEGKHEDIPDEPDVNGGGGGAEVVQEVKSNEVQPKPNAKDGNQSVPKPGNKRDPTGGDDKKKKKKKKKKKRKANVSKDIAKFLPHQQYMYNFFKKKSPPPPQVHLLYHDTGTGKTCTASAIIAALLRGADTVLLLAKNVEIMENFARQITKDCNFIANTTEYVNGDMKNLLKNLSGNVDFEEVGMGADGKRGVYYRAGVQLPISDGNLPVLRWIVIHTYQRFINLSHNSNAWKNELNSEKSVLGPGKKRVVVFVDEIHENRNMLKKSKNVFEKSTGRKIAEKLAVLNVTNIIGMTATPIMDTLYDAIQIILFMFVAVGKVLIGEKELKLPVEGEERTVFREMGKLALLDEQKFASRYSHGSGGKFDLNVEKLEELRNWLTTMRMISWVPKPAKGFPKADIKVIQIPLDKKQIEAIAQLHTQESKEASSGEIDTSFSEFNLFDDEESMVPPKGGKDSFYVNSRQIINFYEEDGKVYSPKIQYILQDLKKDENKKKVSMIYSNFGPNGVMQIAHQLKTNEYKELHIPNNVVDILNKRKGDTDIDIAELWKSNNVEQEDDTFYVYRQGNDNLFTAALTLSRQEQNKHGKYLRVFLITSKHGTGVDYINFRKQYIMEPHFNDAKLQQVRGRVIRNKSLKYHEPNEQTVEIHLLVGINQNNPAQKTADEKLLEMAKQKSLVDCKFRSLFLGAAVDCKENNTYHGMDCTATLRNITITVCRSLDKVS